jgi:hypothetical protein
VVFVAFVIAGLGAAAASRITSREIAIIVGAAILVGCIAGYWAWFARSRYAPGIEALGDHELLERRAWREATGSGMPRTRRRARRWLEEHPLAESTAQRRLTLLVWTDDRAGARATLATIHPESAEEQFFVERDRTILELLEGGLPDLSPAREASVRLTDPTEHRHARVCFALLEARYAVAVGKDPWAPILAARADLPEIAPTVTIRWLTVRLAGVVVVAVTLSIGLALLVR